MGYVRIETEELKEPIGQIHEIDDNATVREYKSGKQIERERAIAISETINEITEAIKDARTKSDYKTVADLTNTMVALLTVTKG